ncbi:MAG TPA: hypothetical protein VIF34_07055 [Methylocystis sp.]|jgi:hypothetical protein
MNLSGIRERLTQALRLSGELLPAIRGAQLSPLSAIVLAALAAITLGAALFAAVAMLGPAGSDVVVSAPDWTPPSLAVVELGPPKPAGADTEALSRPIFSKDRKPSPKTAKAAASIPGQDAAAPAGVTVSAIVKKKKMEQAFMVSPALPEGDWKKVGDTVDAWEISRIDGDGVVLSNGAKTAKVKLFSDDPLAAPSIDGPAPAFPQPRPSPLQTPLP